MIVINELIWVLFLVGFGIAIGWSVREWLHNKNNAYESTEAHGCYGHPELSRWFLMRSKETDPRWRYMPLREYREAKSSVLANLADKN